MNWASRDVFSGTSLQGAFHLMKPGFGQSGGCARLAMPSQIEGAVAWQHVSLAAPHMVSIAFMPLKKPLWEREVRAA